MKKPTVKKHDSGLEAQFRTATEPDLSIPSSGDFFYFETDMYGEWKVLQEIGKTYRDVLDAFREAEAERLLAAGKAQLSDVAFRLGFSDQTAWNRAFRRWKGLSPTEWRQARSDPGGSSPRP
jgi:hypothetical protein